MREGASITILHRSYTNPIHDRSILHVRDVAHTIVVHHHGWQRSNIGQRLQGW
jgi:hypothetical protein